MKKIILSILVLTGFSLIGKSQILIGKDGVTTNPNANLDIVRSDNVPSGILIPRLTVSFLDADASLTNPRYGTDQEGALIFVTDGAGTGTTTDKITNPGFYYFNASQKKWLGIDSKNYGNGSFKPILTTINITQGASSSSPTIWNNWTGTSSEGKPYTDYNYFEFQGTATFSTTKVNLPIPNAWANRTIYIRNNTSGTIHM